jgi:AraC family transcriptional regulator
MVKGAAKMAIGQGVSVWVLDAPDGLGASDYHAHHAIQMTIALEGRLTLATAETSVTAPAIAVKADTRHRIDTAALLAFIFVEPESRAGRILSDSLFGDRDLVEIDPHVIVDRVVPLRDTFAKNLSQEALLSVGQGVVESLAPQPDARLPDPRVQRVIDHAATHLNERLTLNSAAHGVYLSPSRLRHLFVEQTGVAFKTYVLWLRLMRAVQIYADGQRTLTEAAHAAGFADSAHFSRIFKRTFGSPATTLPRF